MSGEAQMWGQWRLGLRQRLPSSLQEARGGQSGCAGKTKTFFWWVVHWEVIGDLQHVHYNQQKGTIASLWGIEGEEFV